MFKLRLAILGAAAALALGTGSALAMHQEGSTGGDSHGDAVAAAAHSCATGTADEHGDCVSAVASTESQESPKPDTTDQSTSPGQVCQAADTDKTETAPAKGDKTAKAADKTEDKAEQQAFVACVKAHAAAESGS